MLSKYYHAEKSSMNLDKVDMNLFISTLSDNLREKYGEIKIEHTTPLGIGTLGVFFELNINGKRKFVKTHRYGATYKENLIKEVEIISFIYKDIIEIEKVNLEINGEEILFMIMDYLFPCDRVVEPDEVRKYISFYQEKLAQKNIDVQYSFYQVLEAGEKSLEEIYLLEFLSKEIYVHCKESLERIKEKEVPTMICHGDLSNVNIMYTKDQIPVVIDWEDSLLAFKEYDYLYWLTFFSQRKFYCTDLLESKGIDKVWGTDIMVLIAIIKSRMSYQNGSFRGNTISFQDRISEIYNMIG